MNCFNNFNNPQVAKLPRHLKQFIVEQHYDQYTPVDHAVWRYVMRQNYSYLKDVAYYPYIPGLEAAGLTIERIPDLKDMNHALAKIGWGAVTVDGFIPPAAFMEYQAYRVLVIAADIRQINHIEYTPAPDIIHESAGHAPIIADTDYHQYLSYFGSIGAKAVFSSRDFELYEAIRHLSILKEMPDADIVEINKAKKKVDFCQSNLGEPSEMALLSRLHWWTVEYGLIGSLENPKIYGAGLLSSIGESAGFMSPDIKKLPYTKDAVNYPFDITQTQPQLFVTHNFQNLIDVLEEFANTMAYRVGGMEGLLKAVECKNICTAVYSSGLQISGVFTDVGIGINNEVNFIKSSSNTALAFDDKELPNHGKHTHSDGFSSPVGKLKGLTKPLENLSDKELSDLSLTEGKSANLVFESGFTVSGTVTGTTRKNGKTLLISFKDCTVKDETGQIFFEPSWGTYDMALGEKIISVFCGAADKDAFEEISLISNTPTVRELVYDHKTQQFHKLYQTVREIRENQNKFSTLKEVWKELKENFSTDWLCSMEILETIHHEAIMPELENEIRIFLEMKAATEPEYTKLINDGFYLIKNPVKQQNLSV
ncbi:MAG: aromatic amino acid hydroxylase [Flavobacterium sp.]|nr:aromatic amino acid hydroxylase [Pedobacter sp.]